MRKNFDYAEQKIFYKFEINFALNEISEMLYRTFTAPFHGMGTNRIHYSLSFGSLRFRPGRRSFLRVRGTSANPASAALGRIP